MPRAKFESLAELLEERPAFEGDGVLPPRLPEWRSFASWAGETDEITAAEGVCIRISPTWYTPRWSRLEALSIDPRESGRTMADNEGRPDSTAKWSALRRTNHLVAGIAR